MMKCFRKRINGLLMILVLSLFGSIILGMSNSIEEKRSVEPQIIFPRAFGIAINQVGYMNGSNIGYNSNEAFYAGIRRKFDVRDYKPFVEIGKEVGIRFKSLFALAELDRLNVVADYPTASSDGENFDNSENISPTQLEIMNYVKDNAAYIEFGVTGVGIEYWESGVRSRSEWYNIEKQEPRPEAIMRKRMKLIKEIISQYGISSEEGHSFPESMSSYGYHWNPDGDVSTGKIWSDHGVKYVNTKFSAIQDSNLPEAGTGGFDHGVLVLDRFTYGNPWNEYASLPDEPVDQYETGIIDSHWPNWLATDDFLQASLNEQWISYFKNIQAHPEYYLAKNTEQLYSQWLYQRFTKVEATQSGVVRIDNRDMTEKAYTYDLLGNMVLKVKLTAGQHVSSAILNGESISAYFEEVGYGFIYLPPLEKMVYELEYDIGSEPMSTIVNNTGTYNIYQVNEDAGKLEFELKMYGTQTVQIQTPRPINVNSNNEYLRILSQKYDDKNKLLFLEIQGRDMQGETGTISLIY